MIFIANHDSMTIHCKQTQTEQCNIDDANKEGSKTQEIDFLDASRLVVEKGYGVCQHCLSK